MKAKKYNALTYINIIVKHFKFKGKGSSVRVCNCKLQVPYIQHKRRGNLQLTNHKKEDVIYLLYKYIKTPHKLRFQKFQFHSSRANIFLVGVNFFSEMQDDNEHKYENLARNILEV